ncbi:hypothetical protein [Methylocaldum sp.]|uniref:hypothetical protein n=1 Tax=Methylocaldum sp. TaxID=1969727 RepID=UPI0032207071
MLLHLHIPRTGGKSVVKWFRQLLSLRDAVYSFKNYQAFWDAFLGRGERHYDFEKIKLITGHFYYGIDEYFIPSAEYVVVLRDPVERVKSLIRYIRKNSTHRLHELFSKASNINYIYRNIHHSPQMSNGQVRQLCSYDLTGLIRLRSHHAETAMNRVIADNVHVFTTDDLDRVFSPSEEKSRMSGISHENGAEQDELCSWLNSETSDAIIRENNELDMRLYDFAKKNRCTDASTLLRYLVE